MNHLQQKQKAKGLIVLVDIKHSHLYNWKLYFFLTFPFFGSKIQHFSTFGSNQDDHDVYMPNSRPVVSSLIFYFGGGSFSSSQGKVKSSASLCMA